MAILGDMGELGEDEALLHRQVGEFAGSLDIDCCVCVGPLCRNLAEGIASTNPQKQVICLDHLEELLQKLPELVQQGDTVLVKASHFMQFEKVVKELSHIR